MEEWNNPSYRFRDTTENDEFEIWLPTSAMIYDGRIFEQEIEGYQTLYVEGREMISLEFETEKKNIGVHISNQRLPERTLTVHYKLSEHNPTEFQRSFKKLMRLLYNESDVQICFNDELDTYYYGRYSAAETVAGNVHSVVSSFTITCADPRKYSKTFETDGQVFSNLPYDVAPISISFTATKDKNVKVTNGRQTISITNSALKKGDKVEMLIREGKILVNGENKTRILDLTSPFKNFAIKTGDVVKSDNGTPLLKYRAVWL
ncbi:distal tail protein Dit [Enterococcus dongliensis]|uniref:distal tail protein Dit n=1 Tax=Enterococcus dongliensis TaxID=2559925 RepID=UPI00288F48A5|nr:distal tail protein Dit [Enterococcus dongliensis]MDT2669156.1 phage tail family protein [Enterococcus dongliensis]